MLCALGVLCCFALFVCLTLLASFFLPSHLSFKNIYCEILSIFLCLHHNHVYNVVGAFCIHFLVKAKPAGSKTVKPPTRKPEPKKVKTFEYNNMYIHATKALVVVE